MSMVNFVQAVHTPPDATVDEENEAFDMAADYAADLEDSLNDLHPGDSDHEWKVTLDV